MWRVSGSKLLALMNGFMPRSSSSQLIYHKKPRSLEFSAISQPVQAFFLIQAFDSHLMNGLIWRIYLCFLLGAGLLIKLVALQCQKVFIVD